MEARVTNVNTQYDDRLQALIASGTPPDMFRIGGDQFARFYVFKAMMQLDVADLGLRQWRARHRPQPRRDVANAIKSVAEPFIARHKELVGKDRP